MATRRPEADDLLRMAEHRRRMRALAKVSESAGRIAASGTLRHLQPVPGTGGDDPAGTPAGDAATADAPAETVVVSLAAVRARRAGHPAGGNRR